MAGGAIKGITISFGADVSKLNEGLKKAQGSINKTQAELKQINRALKFNPGNTTLLRQKFDLLKQSVDQTSGKLKELRTMQSKMDSLQLLAVYVPVLNCYEYLLRRSKRYEKDHAGLRNPSRSNQDVSPGQ